MRLDLFLFEKDYYTSRQKAKYDIENKLIKVNGKYITKPSFDVTENDLIEIDTKEETYVSRAGYKLSKAIKTFQIDCKNKICLDIGASTGGFTDCLLQNGANKIYAVDVGTDQLVESIRSDHRVVSKENLNFRNAVKEDLDNTMFRIVSIDVSFISLKHILSNLNSFIDKDTIIIALIKPQFELYEEANKNKGFISSVDDHVKAINLVREYCNENNLDIFDLTFSPITGEKKDNIEFLSLIKLGSNYNRLNINDVVEQAHKILK